MLNRDDGASLGNPDSNSLADQLHQSIHSGLPLESALRALAEQTQSNRIRITLVSLARKLEEGMPLADAALDLDKKLPRAMSSLIKAGVESGQLGSIMNYSIAQTQRASSLRLGVWLALSYPFFLVWFSSLICCGIILLIVPSFGKILEDFNVDLPGVTQILILVAAFLAWLGLVPWLILLIGGIVAWVLFLLAGFTSWGQRRATSIPILGRAFRFATYSEFCQLMAIFVQAGLPLPKALRFAADASDDRWLAPTCQLIAKEIDEGISPERSAQVAGFPNALAQVFRSASSTERFAEALRGLSEIFAAQSQVAMKVNNAFLAQTAVVFVIGFAGCTVVALFIPLIKLLNDLS